MSVKTKDPDCTRIQPYTPRQPVAGERAAQRTARHNEVGKGPWARRRIRLRPLRYLIPAGVADRGTAQRAVRETAVQRVVDALALPVVRHFQLVLDPGSFGQFHDDVPQVGAVQPPQRNALGQPEDPVNEANLIDLAAVGKCAAGALNDGDLGSPQETID